MTQLEPHEKVLVSREFLDTVHGGLGCEQCHKGNPQAADKGAAHQGLVAMPSVQAPDQACGECHEEIVKSAKQSLHATLKTFPTILKQRADMSKWEAINGGREGHCASCHTSCGGCHVSRPASAKKGFVNGHVFKKRTDPINQCTACHGSRVGNEFYGSRGQGDIHVSQFNMDCVSCHQAKEMHAAAPDDLQGRYHLKEMPACIDCHQGLENGSVRDHQIHQGKVQCQVCHAQTYVGCYSCHTGKDPQGVRYFNTQGEFESLKIGRNYAKGKGGENYNYMLVRHVPVDKELFAFYVKDAFGKYDAVPTWKRTSPHNIRRETYQNASCNHCHGNRELFLSTKDSRNYEVKANEPVAVPDQMIPKKIAKAREIAVPTDKVRTEMVVRPDWLQKNLKKVKVVDARGEGDYKKGHIEGAVPLDIFTAGLREPPESQRPMQLVAFEKLAAIFGERGLTANDHIVVYDKDGRRAGFLLWVLEYAGAGKVSYLDGGVEGWEKAGNHLVQPAPKLKAATWGGKVQPRYLVGNDMVRGKLEDPRVVIVDARIVPQAKGISKHEEAARAGRIPGSINLPIAALYMENGYLKPPQELLYMLSTYGITPDKAIITTCNTGQLAGDAFFMFRYLGFPEVTAHAESWLSWCRVP